MLKLDKINPMNFTVFTEDLLGDRNPEYNLAFLGMVESELNRIAEKCGTAFDDESELPRELIYEVLMTCDFDPWRKFCESEAKKNTRS